MERTLIIGVALALAPVFAVAADDTKKAGDKPSSSMTIQSEPLPAVGKDADGKANASEKKDQKKGAAGPAGPAGKQGAAGASSETSTGTSPNNSAPAAAPSDTKK